MYAEERRQAIATKINQEGRASVHQLARGLDVTTETVRRDLSALERLGLVHRVHGGAMSAQSLTMLETGLGERDTAQVELKDRIAIAAVSQLPPDGGTVLLDAGSTTARVAARLPGDRRWTVVTHSVPIAARLAPRANIDLHLLPGRVRRATQAAVGSETVDAIRALGTDVAFVGTNGVSVGHGLSTPDQEEAATKRALVGSAHRVVVVADSTKIGQERMVQFAGLRDIDVFVTDDRISAIERERIEAARVQVLVA